MGSTVEFTPLPQDVENGNIQFQAQRHFRWWETALRLALIASLLLVVAHRLRQSNTPPPVPPTFSLNSLSVPEFSISDGELYATWDASLTISNTFNLTMQRLDASIWYEDREELARIGPLSSQHLGVVPEQEKRMNLKVKTTGWEKDQPIVDDMVIAGMAEDRKRGLIRFSMKIRVEGELSSCEWALGFMTYPICHDLEVRFPSAEKGGAAVLIRGNATSCPGLTEWDHVRSLL